ncbi:MAG TPA: hypothetical protein VLX92_15275 [Kofleriaceae bacterium]|nr:hypothetical protein [Kofleriaceae bacterium]
MRRLSVLALAGLASCSKGDATTGGSQGSGSAAAAPPAAVEIFVDDHSVAKLTPAQLATWPRVDTLVPVSARRLGTWLDVAAKGTAEKDLHRPSDTYPDLVPALYPGDDGKPAFGMFDPVELARHGKPKLGQDGVRELRIKLAQDSGRGQHESGQGGGSDPALLVIDIQTPAGTSKLEGKTLLAIPRSGMPGDDSKEPKGWPLAQLLDAAGIKSFHTLLLTDTDGLNLTLEKRDFDDQTSIPFVKLNRQGALRVTVFKKQGQGWQKGGDLRGLAAIQVVK